MTRLSGLILALSIIGFASAYQFYPRVDIPRTEAEIIRTLESNANKIKDEMTDFIQKHILQVKESEKNIEHGLDKFRTTVSSYGESFDNIFKKVFKGDVSDKTCHIIGFRDYILSMYDMTRHCAMRAFDSIQKDLYSVTVDTTRIWKEFEVGKARILNCKNITTDNAQVAFCLHNEALQAQKKIQSISNVLYTLRHIAQGPKVSATISDCVAKNSTKILTQKITDVAECLGNKSAKLQSTALQVAKASSILETKVISSVQYVSEHLIDYLNKIEAALVPVIWKISYLIKEMMQKFKEMGMGVKENLNGLWSTITG